ncbi:MAG TPA: InlB B-repeat-containing protein, partial [Methanocorpusculum sp.]|nr:InlB B-repeat-containing protein [Methanocorpusculum sp.]
MLIQNYCNLTLENVTLDGTNLPGSYPYTLSNNCGNTVLKGNTKIIAADDGVAFDVCYAPTKGYSEGVSVTIASDTVVISGPVEYGIWGTSDSDRAEKAIFNVPYGYDVDLTVSKPEESHGYYYWKATSDNQMVFTLKENSPIKVLQDNAVVSADGSTVTLLRDTTLDEPILIETPITFDGNGKTINGESTTGYFLMVAVPRDGNEGKSVTLQNLNLNIGSIGGSANLGGITVRANADNDASVPVILKNSIVDMSDVDMTGTTSMNPAVYFVNASGSQIINNNKITAGAASSSSTRCVVVDGGSGVIVSGNKLTLGSVSGTAVAVGVEIKGNDVDKVTVSGNTLATGSGSGEEPRAVKITAKDTGSQKTFTVSKNTIQFGGKGTTVEVLLSTYEITDPANARVNLDVEENTGNTASVVMLNKGNADDDTVLTSTITLTGNIYNPALTSSEEVAVVGGFIEEGSTQPNTDDVTHVNPAPQPVYSSGGNMNNAYRVLFNDGSTTLSVQTDLSSGDKLTKPETPVKDGYTFAGWYKDSACTQGWDFETGISGDMTLYAKWTAAGSSGETEATATPT